MKSLITILIILIVYQSFTTINSKKEYISFEPIEIEKIKNKPLTVL